MRKALRGAVEFAMVASGLPVLGRRRRRGDTLVLAYHNVVPDGAEAFGDRSLHLPLSRLRQQLAALEATHEVVSLDELETPARTERPRAAITFDDAYAGALHLGVPAVLDAGFPVTIFVAPGLLGREAMWWDLLADPCRGLDAAVRAHALDGLRGEHEAIMAWAREQGLTVAMPAPHARIGTPDELRAVARRPGVSIGLHTWAHPNMARLDHGEALAELVRTRDWLRENIAPARPWLAYPYGLFGEPAIAAARAAGLARAFRVDGGWMRPATGPSFAAPRSNVPAGLSEHGFVLRLAGLPV